MENKNKVSSTGFFALSRAQIKTKNANHGGKETDEKDADGKRRRARETEQKYKHI